MVGRRIILLDLTLTTHSERLLERLLRVKVPILILLFV